MSKEERDKIITEIKKIDKAFVDSESRSLKLELSIEKGQQLELLRQEFKAENDVNNNRCDYCNTKTHLPHRCKFCGRLQCSEHLLPENHECSGRGFKNGKPIPKFHQFIKGD